MKQKKLAFVLLFVSMLFVASAACAEQPKYVFFFLGDGMANSQIQATEAYLTTLHGGSATLAADLQKPENRLNMCKMPIQGMQTTYDAHALMTDSASAGTAFACGIKTLSGVIGMDENKTISYKSIAQLAHERGKKVGIITSVSLDHATPASYYASVPNRGYMNNVATQLAESGYEFFGGGGLVSPEKEDRTGDTNNNVWSILAANGYTVLQNRADIKALLYRPKNKVVCINPWLQDSSAMPYDIDRRFKEEQDPTDPNRNLSLAEMTEVAIQDLDRMKGRHDKGFFLMVEGGKIDWACHANDAMAAVGDMIDFDNAIGVALNFYRKHPAQTLIVVTGDHETGGMTIGHATTAYTAYYDRLLGQKNSFTYFDQVQLPEHVQSHPCTDPSLPNNLESDTDMINLMSTVFGLTWADLNDYQKAKLEDAYDKTVCGSNDNLKAENDLLYGSYDPLTVTITHILNERASIGWTSYSHTGVPVPVYAQGVDSTLFSGFYDNTDIAKRLARAMDIRQRLPVEK